MNNPASRTVIVADGSFPAHPVPLQYISNAERIICCDGSTGAVVRAGYIPFAIVGDMDSLDTDLALRFADRIHTIDEQETNDLTKAVNWCVQQGYDDLVIIGATGKREDHTIGNVSLLAEYIRIANVIIVTDTGYFIPANNSITLESFPGQQISVFSIDPATAITSGGLRYQLQNTRLTNWWQATLNESISDRFRLEFSDGRLIVYLKFPG